MGSFNVKLISQNFEFIFYKHLSISEDTRSDKMLNCDISRKYLYWKDKYFK